MEREPANAELDSSVNASPVPTESVSASRTVGPLDLSPLEFRAGLMRRADNHRFFVQFCRDNLRPDIDYGSVLIRGRPSKPCLRKPGAEKICNMGGVTATFPSLRDYERNALEGREIRQPVIRCELHNPDGAIVGEGAGARSLEQDYNDLNKTLKMCLKSAYIDATIRCFGLSEIFTQDLEDMPESLRAAEGEEPYAQHSPDLPVPPAMPPPPPRASFQAERPAARAPMRASTGARVISDKQVKLLCVRLDQSGVPETEFCKKWQIPQLEALPASQMNEALGWLSSVHP